MSVKIFLKKHSNNIQLNTLFNLYTIDARKGTIRNKHLLFGTKNNLDKIGAPRSREVQTFYRWHSIRLKAVSLTGRMTINQAGTKTWVFASKIK